jgi:hypothetical protein
MVRALIRRGQSAVETMMMMPLLVLVFVALYYLWSICFASYNAHLRAREYVLHGAAYLGSRGDDANGSTVFDEGSFNYEKATSTTFDFSASASDVSIPGVAAAGEDIEVTAEIASSY